VLFLILMIYGGFTWMTSNGNQEAVGKAQKIVGSAVIGLVIVLSAYVITVYMGTTFSDIQP
jgi:TRAP-type C4-dicarboxylate transport system permease small subunit